MYEQDEMDWNNIKANFYPNRVEPRAATSLTIKYEALLEETQN